MIPIGFMREWIVTDGLILNLDTGDIGSYSGSGTTWYDLSNSGNNGTLVNSPSFNSRSNNSSYFNFNGVTQCIDLGANTNLSSISGNLSLIHI